MKARIEDRNKSGIYCIKNTINNKKYVGKAKCIFSRIKQHILLLNKKSKDENIHLINSWHKNGKNAFEYEVLEYIDFDESILKEKELYYILQYNCLHREYGYNLRLDTSTGMVISEETRVRLKDSQIKRFKKVGLEKTIEPLIKYREKYKTCEKTRASYKKNTSLGLSKYYIDQYNKNGDFIRRWDSIYFLMQENPTYKQHNIYAVCSGEKPSIYGYVFKKVKK